MLLFYLCSTVFKTINEMTRLFPFIVIFALIFSACTTDSTTENIQTKTYKTIGSIEKLDDALDNILATDATIEILATGFSWSEGPLWLEKEQKLLFSDVPKNQIFQWSEKDSASLYLMPSGFTGDATMSGDGSNGLLLSPTNQLVLCQHGNRQMAIMKSALDTPKADFLPLATHYNKKRFDSPNDACYHKSGDLYFTDPPYGLPKQASDPTKELPYQGVFRIQKDGTVDLLIDSITRPNGIAFSPDYKTLYVASSDPAKAIWYAYDVLEDGTVDNGRVFYDATHLVDKDGEQGLPDGLKVNSDGIIFASGPGGIWIFSPDATVLGKVRTTQATSNCALDTNEKTLYMTADGLLLRIKLR